MLLPPTCVKEACYDLRAAFFQGQLTSFRGFLFCRLRIHLESTFMLYLTLKKIAFSKIFFYGVHFFSLYYGFERF